MAENPKHEKQALDDSFSIILGKRVSGADKGQKAEESRVKPQAKKEPGEKKPVKRKSLEELLKRKDELELFLASLEEARAQSKLPEYSYEKIKKKGELELSTIGKEIKEIGYGSIKKEGDELSKNLTEIKKAVTSLQGGRVIDTAYNQKQAPDYKKLEEINGKLNELSNSLLLVTKKLSERINEIAAAEDTEITDSVGSIKREIDAIRSELSKFVLKSDLEKLVFRNRIGIHQTSGPVHSEHEKSKGVVAIKDIPKFAGRRVTVQGSISLFKSIENAGNSIYWYRIADKSGSGILTSYEKLDEKKAKVYGKVKKTGSGSFYILFSGVA